MEKDEQRERRAAGSRRRLILRLVAAVAALCAIVAVWRIASNLPDSLERRISKELSTSEAIIEVSGLSIGFPLLSLKAESFAVYPRQGPRRAALSVSGAELRLRPNSLQPDAKWLREVRLESIEFDVDTLSSLGGDSGDGGAIPDFGPVILSIRRAAGLGLEIRDLRGALSVRQGNIDVEDLAVSFQGRGEHEQTLRGRVCVEPSAPAVEAYGAGDFDFTKILQTLREQDCDDIAVELGKFEFQILPPQVEIMFYWAPERKTRSLIVSIKAGPMRYNGVRLSGLDGIVHVSGSESWERVDIDPLKIRRPEGAVSGSLSLDIDNDLLEFDYDSTIDPVSFAAMAELVDPESLPDIEFENPTDIRCSGVLDIGEGDGSRSSISVLASVPGATVRGFSFSNISVVGGVRGNVIDFPRITAGAMGGSLEATFKVEGVGDDKNVSASIAIRDVPQSQWASLVGREVDAMAGGTLDASATFDGPLEELGGKVPTRGRGTFSADMRNALLFRIPLFAGLTGVLVDFIPGVNFLVDQNNAHVSATLEDGLWNVSELSVSGTSFTIDGSGTASADGSDINVVARVRIMNRRTWLGRIVQQLLSPLSGLLGIRATGSIESPHWAMSPFSRSPAK